MREAMEAVLSKWECPEIVLRSDLVTIVVVAPTCDGHVIAADRAVLTASGSGVEVAGDRSKLAIAPWGAITLAGVVATIPPSLDGLAAIEHAATLDSGSHAVAFLCDEFDRHAVAVRGSDGVPFVGMDMTIGVPALTMALVVERTPSRVLRTQVALAFLGETSYYRNAPPGPVVIAPPDDAVRKLFVGAVERAAERQSADVIGALQVAFERASQLTSGRITTKCDFHVVPL